MVQAADRTSIIGLFPNWMCLVFTFWWYGYLGGINNRLPWNRVLYINVNNTCRYPASERYNWIYIIMLTLIPFLMTLCLIKSIQYSKQSSPLTHAIFSETSFYYQGLLSACFGQRFYILASLSYINIPKNIKNNEDTKISLLFVQERH